ncbi:MAG: lysophospholipid acyltransferase family protein [Gemmatimonadota bacterium]|nr:lysophospholipid acyltransferase family protein [Gemmatimonadota bacterium]
MLALLGWRVEGNLPAVHRAVIIVAPHTSNWDFVIGIAAKLGMGLHASWLGKHTLFRGPFGWFMRRLGGIPVDRSRPQDAVAQAVARFAASERMVLGLAPEGTRRAVPRWRSGYYHIAHGAGVPIVPVALDWPTRTLVVGPSVQPSDDMPADLAALGAFYQPWRGRRGEVTPPPL